MSYNISTHYPLGGNDSVQLCGVNEPLLPYGFLTKQVENCCNERQLNIGPQAVQTFNNCTKYCEYGGTPSQWESCVKLVLTDAMSRIALPYCDGENDATRAQASAASSAVGGTSPSTGFGTRQMPANLGGAGWAGTAIWCLVVGAAAGRSFVI